MQISASELFLMLSFAWISFVASVAGALTESQEVLLAGGGVEHMRENAMLGFCLAASIGGSILSVCMFPEATIRQTAFKFSGSVIASMLFSPMVIHWFKLNELLHGILAVAGAISFFIWAALELVTPKVLRWAGKAADQKLQSFTITKEEKP